jgi:hypothetical protein
MEWSNTDFRDVDNKRIFISSHPEYEMFVDDGNLNLYGKKLLTSTAAEHALIHIKTVRSNAGVDVNGGKSSYTLLADGITHLVLGRAHRGN